MAKLSDRPMFPNQGCATGLTKYVVAAKLETAQRNVIVKYILFKVTTCLYLSPSNRARSLSKLIKVVVPKDKEHRT